jgi:transcriptional regulator with XRE-family HTH domain
MKSESFILIDRICALMRQLEISDAELARQIGVPQGTVSRILSGETKDPRISTVAAIARVLGATVDYLVGSADLNTIPLLDWNEIIHFTKFGIDDSIPRERISTSEPAAEGSFAVKTTPSMAPRYRNGSIIIVQPSSFYRDFQVAIVSFAGGDPAVRRLIKDGSTLLFKKLDDSPSIPPVPHSPGDVIIGVVTEARMVE